MGLQNCILFRKTIAVFLGLTLIFSNSVSIADHNIGYICSGDYLGIWSQLPKILPQAKMFITAQAVHGRLIENGFETNRDIYEHSEGFKKIVFETIRNYTGAGTLQIEDVKCLIFADKNNSQKHAYYYFFPGIDCFVRLSDSPEVSDYFHDVISGNTLLDQPQKVTVKNKPFLQEVYKIDIQDIEFLNLCLEKVYPGSLVLKTTLEGEDSLSPSEIIPEYDGIVFDGARFNYKYRVLAFDVDGTILRRGEKWDNPGHPVKTRFESLLQEGIKMFLISNNDINYLLERIIQYVPTSLRKNIIIYSNAGARKFSFDINGDIMEDKEHFNGRAITLGDFRILEQVIREVMENSKTRMEGNRHIYMEKYPNDYDFSNIKFKIDIRGKDEKSGDVAQLTISKVPSRKLKSAKISNNELDERELVVQEIKDRLPPRIRDRLRFQFSGPVFIDINVIGVDKKASVENLISDIGIRVDEITYFGDEVYTTGNDAIVMETGVRVIAVNRDQDTVIPGAIKGGPGVEATASWLGGIERALLFTEFLNSLPDWIYKKMFDFERLKAHSPPIPVGVTENLGKDSTIYASPSNKACLLFNQSFINVYLDDYIKNRKIALLRDYKGIREKEIDSRKVSGIDRANEYTILVEEIIRKVAQVIGLEREGIAFLGWGTLGQRIMVKYSDLDLIIVVNEDIDLEWLKKKVEELKKILLGFGYPKVDLYYWHGINEVVEKSHISSIDMGALGRSRYLFGDEKVYHRLMDILKEDYYKSSELLENCLRLYLAQQKRSLKYTSSEPNLKYSVGSLRDLEVIIYSLFYRNIPLNNVFLRDALDLLKQEGDITEEEREIIEEAANFLLELRYCVHEANNTVDDILHEEIQDEIAKKMGLRDGFELLQKYNVYTKIIRDILIRIYEYLIKSFREQNGEEWYRVLSEIFDKKENVDIGRQIEIIEKGDSTLVIPISYYTRSSIVIERIFQRYSTDWPILQQICSNPSAPTHILAALTDYKGMEWRDIRLWTARNEYTPIEPLRDIIVNPQSRELEIKSASGNIKQKGVIALDVDDTLLPPPDSNARPTLEDIDKKEEFLKLIRTGIKVCLMTGTLYSTVKKRILDFIPPGLRKNLIIYSDNLSVKTTFDSNGNEVRGEEYMRDAVISHNDAEILFSVVNAAIDHYWNRYLSDSQELLGAYPGFYFSKPVILSNDFNPFGITNIKIMSIPSRMHEGCSLTRDIPDERERVIHEIKGALSNDLLDKYDIGYDGRYSIYIVKKGINKKGAMRDLIKQVPSGSNYIIYFGDEFMPGGNDYILREVPGVSLVSVQKDQSLVPNGVLKGGASVTATWYWINRLIDLFKHKKRHDEAISPVVNVLHSEICAKQEEGHIIGLTPEEGFRILRERINDLKDSLDKEFPVYTIIVDEKGNIVGEGKREEIGEFEDGTPVWSHAELSAIRDAESGGYKDWEKYTLITNLEPCIGCAIEIMARRFKNCYIGCLDPNPYIYGEGLKILYWGDINIEVATGEINRGFRQMLNWTNLSMYKDIWDTFKCDLSRKIWVVISYMISVFFERRGFLDYVNKKVIEAEKVNAKEMLGRHLSQKTVAREYTLSQHMEFERIANDYLKNTHENMFRLKGIFNYVLNAEVLSEEDAGWLLSVLSKKIQWADMVSNLSKRRKIILFGDKERCQRILALDEFLMGQYKKGRVLFLNLNAITNGLIIRGDPEILFEETNYAGVEGISGISGRKDGVVAGASRTINIASESLNKIISFLARRDKLPEKADLIMVLGSDDKRVPLTAAELFKKGLAEKILVSGCSWDILKGKVTPEARIYRDILLGEGVPEEAIIVEDESTSTLENIVFSKKIIEGKDIPHNTVILIQSPIGQRTAGETFRKQFNRDAINYASYVPDTFGMSDEELLHVARNAYIHFCKLVYYGPTSIEKIDVIKVTPDIAEGGKQLREYLIDVEMKDIIASGVEDQRLARAEAIIRVKLTEQGLPWKASLATYEDVKKAAEILENRSDFTVSVVQERLDIKPLVTAVEGEDGRKKGIVNRVLEDIIKGTNRRILVFDLNGTLLNQTETYKDFRTSLGRYLVIKLLEEGYFIVINTTGPFKTIMRDVIRYIPDHLRKRMIGYFTKSTQKIRFDTNIDGEEVEDYRYTYNTDISPEDRKIIDEVIEYAKKYYQQLIEEIMKVDKDYPSRHKEKYKARVIKDGLFKPGETECRGELVNGRVAMMAVPNFSSRDILINGEYYPTDIRAEVIDFINDEFKKRFEDRYKAVKGGSTTIDIIRSYVSKGIAVRDLIENEGFLPEDIFYIADGLIENGDTSSDVAVLDIPGVTCISVCKERTRCHPNAVWAGGGPIGTINYVNSILSLPSFMPLSRVPLLREVQLVARQAAVISASKMKQFKIEKTGDLKEQKKEASYSIVTEADRDIQKEVVGLIRSHFSNHGIVGEEELEGVDPKRDAEYVWVIDPIDGTKSYVDGHPDYGFLIALLHNGEPIMSLLYAPEWDIDGDGKGALFEAVEDIDGAYLNGKRIYVSDLLDFKNQEIRITRDRGDGCEDEKEVAKVFGKISRTERTQGFDMVKVAMSGNYEGPVVYSHRTPKIWDAVASIFIVKKAGGVVTDFNGRPVLPFNKDRLAETIPKFPNLIASPKQANKLLLNSRIYNLSLDGADVQDLSGYEELVEKIAEQIIAGQDASGKNVFVVSIDGGYGIGKSTLMKSLERALNLSGKSTEVLERDWFLKDREETRKAFQEWEKDKTKPRPVGERDDVFKGILEQIGSYRGNLSFTVFLKELYNRADGGRLSLEKEIAVKPGSIVLVEAGRSIQDPWKGYFDLRILLLGNPEVVKERVWKRERDNDNEDYFNKRYKNACNRFIDRVRETNSGAHLIVILDDFDKPILIKQGGADIYNGELQKNDTQGSSGLIIRGDSVLLFDELRKQKDNIKDLRPGIDRKKIVEQLRTLLEQKGSKFKNPDVVNKILHAILDIEAFSIKEFSAIVLGQDKPKKERQWLLGFNSLASPMAEYLQKLFPNPTLGYAREVLDNLSGDALLEYLLHEALCRYTGHYEARRIQEVMFEETNYQDAKGEDGRKEGVVNKVLAGIRTDYYRGDYYIIDRPSIRQYLLASAIRIVEWTRSKGVKTIMINGYSAKPAAKLIEMYWREVYPETLPQFVYLPAKREYDDREEVIDTISKISNLADVISNSILIIDELAQTGGTLYKSKRVLEEEFGAKEVYTAALVLHPAYKEEVTYEPTIKPENPMDKYSYFRGKWNWHLVDRYTSYWEDRIDQASPTPGSPASYLVVDDIDKYYLDLAHDLELLVEQRTGPKVEDVEEAVRIQNDKVVSSGAIIHSGEKGEFQSYYIGEKKDIKMQIQTRDEVPKSSYHADFFVDMLPQLIREYGRPIGTVCEVGTGRGTVSVAMGLLSSETKISVLDINPLSVELAKENAGLNGISDRFEGICGNLLEPVMDRRFDVIISTLPSQPVSEEREAELDRETLRDVSGGRDGGELIRAFIRQAKDLLNPGGEIWFVMSDWINANGIVTEEMEKVGLMPEVITLRKKYLDETEFTKKNRKDIERLGYAFSKNERGEYFNLVVMRVRMIPDALITPPLSVIEPENPNDITEDERRVFIDGVLKYQEAGADGIHFDVREKLYLNKLVERGVSPDRSDNRKLLNPEFIKELRDRGLKLFIDVHLLYYKPDDKYLVSYKGLGVRSILVHYNGFDSEEELADALRYIRTLGIRSGVVIELDEPVSLLTKDILEEADIVVFSSAVTTGIDKPHILVEDKVRRLKGMGYRREIMIQGSINPYNINIYADAGANIFVVGSYLKRSVDMREAIELLKMIAVDEIKVNSEEYFLSGLNNSRIRKYITDLMAFCFGQFGIGREEVERMVEIIARSRSFDEAKRALYEAGFMWKEEENRYNVIYSGYKRDKDEEGVTKAAVVKYNTLKEYIRRGGFGKNAVVIDIGCGNHEIARQMINEMRREGVEEDLIPIVIGVDFREEKGVDVTDKYGKLKYQTVETVGKVPVEGESIANKVFIFSSLHHMDEDVIMSILSEANRILKPDGELVVFEDVVLEGQNPKYNEQGLAVERIKELSEEERRIAFTVFDWHANCVVSGDDYVPMPGSYFTESKWRSIFDKVGFYVDYSEYVGVYKGKFSNLPHSVFVLKKTGSIKGYDDEAYAECVEDMKGVKQITEEEESIATITDSIVSGREQGRAFVVAIDGNSGALKSSTATRVADILESRGQKVVVIRRDWFIRGRTERYGEIKKELRDNEVSLRDEEMYLRIEDFEKKILQALDEFNNGTEPETTIHLADLYDKYGGGELTGYKDIPIDRNTVVIIEGNYLLKERWSRYFDLKVIMLTRPSTGIARRKDRDTHTALQEVAKMFWRMNTPSFINYLRGKMPNAKMGRPDIVIHTDSWVDKYRELYEIDVNNARLSSGCKIIGERGWTDREKKMISEVIDKLVSMYGFGILAVIDAIRVVDGLKGDSMGDIIEEDGRYILLLDISSFGVPEFDRGDSEYLLDAIMERELIRRIMSIIPAGDNVIRGLTINYMVLKSAYNRGLKISKETIEEIGADEQFFEALEVLQAMKEVLDNDIIAVAIEHTRAIPYYAELFRQFSFAGDWAEKIKDTEDRYKAALCVFNDIAEAREMAKKVKDTTRKIDNKIIGLGNSIKKIRMVVSRLPVIETGFLDALVRNNKYIMLDRSELAKPENKHIKDWIEKLVQGKERRSFIYSDEDIPEGINREDVIHLVEPEKVNEQLPKNRLYLPLPYSVSSIYLASQVVLAGGKVAQIKDKLAMNTIRALYDTLLGRDVTDAELEVLFRMPWKVLPPIVQITGALNALRKAIAEIEKAA